MTEQPTSIPTDEELSLALDGHADADLLARIAASDDASARLEELRTVSAAVAAATVDPLRDEVVDNLVATALDTPVAPPRTQSRGRATPWLVAAAVLVLMAAGLSLVWAGRGTTDDQASASLEDVPEASEGAAETGAADQSTARSAQLPLSFLGSYATGAELRAATATALSPSVSSTGGVVTLEGELGTTTEPKTTGPDAAAPPSSAAVDRCAEQLRVTLSLEAGPLQAGYAQVDGAEVLVYEFAATSTRNGKETTLVAAVGSDACNEIVVFER